MPQPWSRSKVPLAANPRTSTSVCRSPLSSTYAKLSTAKRWSIILSSRYGIEKMRWASNSTRCRCPIGTEKYKRPPGRDNRERLSQPFKWP